MKAKKFIRNTPHLPVRNLRRTLDYYRDTLGFYDQWTFGDKDGGINRDEMRLLFAEDKSFTDDIITISIDWRLCGLSTTLMEYFLSSKRGKLNWWMICGLIRTD